MDEFILMGTRTFWKAMSAANAIQLARYHNWNRAGVFRQLTSCLCGRAEFSNGKSAVDVAKSLTNSAKVINGNVIVVKFMQ
jgi:hypothetical protein